MPSPPPTRSRFSLEWLAGWSMAERVVIAAAWLIPIVVLGIGGRKGGWIAGCLSFVAFVLLNIVVWRHGGWKILGPHFFYDVIRLARRGRSTFLRVVYLLALLIGLSIAIQRFSVERVWQANDFARVSESFAFALFLVQNIAVMILTPAYVASAIAEERERKTLELLFTTQLTNTEIVLGIYISRVIHLVGFVLAGLPILTVIQFWGGIDILLLLGNLANTILNILTIGSLCLFVSTMTRTVTSAVMTSYAILLPIVCCCVGGMGGTPFVLQDSRSAGLQYVTVQDLGALFLIHATVSAVALGLSAGFLRQPDTFNPASVSVEGMDISEPPARRGRPTAPLPATGVTDQPEVVVLATLDPRRHGRLPAVPKEPERLDALAVPYTLPPITDNALVWYERFLGGPALAFSPILLIPMIPFLATGVLLMVVWYVRGLFIVEHVEFDRMVSLWFGVLRFFYYAFLACYALGVGFRAASSVARERQQQTLEPLLLLPIDRVEILWAKMIGILWRGWPWFALVFLDLAFGTLIGAYHPLSAFLLCLAPWPFLLCFANLGLLFSIVSATVLRANIFLVLTLMGVISVSVLLPTYVGPLSYVETFAFTSWSDGLIRSRRTADLYTTLAIVGCYSLGAWVCWWTAQRRFEQRAREM